MCSKRSSSNLECQIDNSRFETGSMHTFVIRFMRQFLKIYRSSPTDPLRRARDSNGSTFIVGDVSPVIRAEISFPRMDIFLRPLWGEEIKMHERIYSRLSEAVDTLRPENDFTARDEFHAQLVPLYARARGLAQEIARFLFGTYECERTRI